MNVDMSKETPTNHEGIGPCSSPNSPNGQHRWLTINSWGYKNVVINHKRIYEQLRQNKCEYCEELRFLTAPPD